MLNTLAKRFLPPPDPNKPHPQDQYVPKKIIRKSMREEIDILYGLCDTLIDGDVAVYTGKRKWVLTVTRVDRGLILKIMDNHLFTLNHNDDLLQFMTGETAGFGPAELKSRYAVSQLLKNKLDRLGKLGIDLNSKPNIIRPT